MNIPGVTHTHTHTHTHVFYQSPDEVCKVLGLCSSSQTAVSGVFCEVCDLVIYLVRDAVFTSKTEVCGQKIDLVIARLQMMETCYQN